MIGQSVLFGVTCNGGRLRTDNVDTYQWTSRPRASGAYSRSEPTVVLAGSDSADWSLHTAGPEQHAGPRHSTAPMERGEGRRPGAVWTGSKAETEASRAGTGREQDVAL